MSERKNIDRLFQEKFKDFEAEPSDLSWSKIEARLEEKKKRRVIPIWFRLSGVAAILLIGFLLTMQSGNDGGLKNGSPVVDSSDGPNGKKPGNNVPAGTSDASPGSDAIVSSDAAGTEPAAADRAHSGEEADKSGQLDLDRKSINPKGSNASGIRQKDAGVAAYPSHKKTKSNSKAGKIKGKGVSENEIAPLNNADDQRYANASDNAKNKRGGKKAGHSQISEERDSQIVRNSNKASEVRNAQNNLNNFKTENKIAVNENNQSGQTQQHNERKVTEPITTSTQAIAVNTDDIKMDSTALAMAAEPNALEELLKNEKENKSVTENEPKMNRWQVSPRVAPIYLSSSSNGSPIDSRFAKNEKDFKTQLSYGLGVSYAMNKRLSVRAGVNSLSFEYNTNNVVAMQTSVGRQQLQHVRPTVQGAFLRVDNLDPGAPAELANNGMVLKKFDSSLSQKTGYLEVPVELSYRLLNKRFGIDVIGGFSTLFLNENKISVIASDSEMHIGKANNLNETSFSTNVGIGFRYEIWKALQVNFEPMFKYQINTYSESGNFKPYFFGLYTGLNYRF